jgi:hypothetical protein
VEFFVPVADEEIEEIYEELATMAGGSAPARTSARVYSVTWTPASTASWTATVGEQLAGPTSATLAGTERPDDRSPDPATVLAIFPGRPFLVLTTAEPFGRTTSAWANPLPVSEPTTVEYFD